MKIYSSGRGGGKTLQMVKWLRESSNHILVVRTHAEATRLEGLYPGDHNFRIVPVDSIKRETQRGGQRYEVRIDGIEEVFKMLGIHVTGFSVNDADWVKTRFLEYDEMGSADTFYTEVVFGSDACFHGHRLDNHRAVYSIIFGGSRVISKKVVGNIFENPEIKEQYV